MKNILLKLPAVQERTSLSRSMIYALIAKGKFPRQIKTTERSVSWIENEINIWIEEQITKNKKDSSPDEERT